MSNEFPVYYIKKKTKAGVSNNFFPLQRRYIFRTLGDNRTTYRSCSSNVVVKKYIWKSET